MARLRGLARRLLPLALAAALLFWDVAPALAAPAVAGIEDYRRRVIAARDVAVRLAPGAGDERTAHDLAAQVNTLLPGGERVRLDGRVVEVDNSFVRSLVASIDALPLAGMRRDSAALLAGHLESLVLALDEAGGPVPPSDEAALRRLVAEQAPEGRSSLSRWVSRMADRLGAWLRSRWARLSGPDSSPVATVAMYLVLALLASLAGWVAWRVLSRILAQRASAEVAPPGPDAPVVAAAAGLPPDALAYAEELAGEARFREAVRALFGGAARALVDLGLVPQTRTRTNAELLADVRPAQTTCPPLGALSHAFERAWYGHVDPGREGYAAARELYGETLAAASRDAAALPAGEAAT